MLKTGGPTKDMLDGMERVPGSRVRMSENFEWDEGTDQIVDIRPGRHGARSSSQMDARIDVYDDRVEHWVLAPVQRLVARRVPVCEDYVAAATLLSYFEGVEAFRRGEDSHGKSSKFFVASAVRVLGVKKSVATRLYKDFRCGMFHIGFTYSRAYLMHGLSVAVGVGADGYLRLDPFRLYERVVADHRTYIADLRSETKPIITNFARLWETYWDRS